MKTFKEWLHETFDPDFLNSVKGDEDVRRMQQGWSAALEAVIEDHGKQFFPRELSEKDIETFPSAKPGVHNVRFDEWK